MTSSPTAGWSSGIGAGWNEEESGAYGIELGSIKERFDRFEEACEVLTSLLSNETTNFDGKFYQLKDARNEPKGPQRPHPPICIGGSGEKRTLRITARYAQHWNFVGGPPDLFAHKRDVLASHCADIGRDPKEITQVGAPAPGARPQLREGHRGRGRHWPPKAWTWASCTSRRRMTRPCWSRWRRRSGTRGWPPDLPSLDSGEQKVTKW